ncbi:major facilitator superfamily domain-containing protein [Lophiotrema nucula]|uniref:Major facilitator superfamily domain-containing protein n=1 Tax=Lophiotrema nucula TaxID=690887 RepID=A0A6A5ZRA9_9PLEO|nr:major facilitator superfamily domain-containing protein [Lophiotrema nucula]
MADEQERVVSETRSAAVDEKHDDATHQDDGEVTEYPSKAKLTIITTALCLAVFLMALDNAIIATAIPRITEQFHSLTDVGWYGSAYLLTTAALQLQFGKFYTYLSIKWVFLTAVGIFELGSLLCGVARSSTMLIVGRAIAGLGAAGIYSGALIILANSVPLPKRPAYIGLIGSMYGVSSVAGPLLGGAFTDKATWRWCFYINLPIGAITVVLITFFFPQPQQHKPPREPLLKRIDRFDPIGTLLLVPAVICLLLALQWGGIKYSWSNGRIIALFILGGLLLIGFVGVQLWKQDKATVPPRVFRNRTVWASSLYAFGLGASFFIGVYYIPIWFQAVKGTSAVGSGIRNLPMMLSAVLLSILAGVLVTVQGHYAPYLYVGTVLMSIGAGLLSTWNPDTKSSVWIGYQILFGVGVGVCLQQPMVAVQTVLDIKDVPVGASLIVFIQSLGGAMFVSVGETVLTNQLVKELAKNAPSIHPADVIAAGSSRLQSTFHGDVLRAIVLSYNNALSKVFIVATAMAAFTIVGCVCVEWKSVKGKKVEMAMA